MKISRLRRTLAVFLSALMLTLCAPMSAFTLTASANSDTCSGNHANATDLNNTELSSQGPWFLVFPGGDCYLSDDYTTEKGLYVKEDCTLCLNGHTLTIDSTRYLNVAEGVTLTICDCSGTPGKIASQSSTGYGVIYASGTVNINDGVTIEATTTDVNNIVITDTGNVVMNNGTIKSATCVSADYEDSTAVKIETAGGRFTMNDGTICGACKYGIYDTSCTEGAITLNGGIIKDTVGAALYGAATMNGVTIQGNASPLYIFPTTQLSWYTIAGNTVIKDNTTDLDSTKYRKTTTEYGIVTIGALTDSAKLHYSSLVEDTTPVAKLGTGAPENVCDYLVDDSGKGKSFYVKDGYVYYGTAPAVTEYTITFDPNEGTLPNGTTNTATTTEGKLTSLPTPTRAGYSFKGWFDAKTDGYEVTKETTFTESKTIYAQWEQLTEVSKVEITLDYTNYPKVIIGETADGSKFNSFFTIAESNNASVNSIKITDAYGNNVTVYAADINYKVVLNIKPADGYMFTESTTIADSKYDYVWDTNLNADGSIDAACSIGTAFNGISGVTINVDETKLPKMIIGKAVDTTAFNDVFSDNSDLYGAFVNGVFYKDEQGEFAWTNKYEDGIEYYLLVDIILGEESKSLYKDDATITITGTGKNFENPLVGRQDILAFFPVGTASEETSTEDTIKEVTITVDTSKLPKLIAGQKASVVCYDYLKAFTLSEGVSFENVFGFYDSNKKYTTEVVAGNDYYMYTSIRPSVLTKVFDDSVTMIDCQVKCNKITEKTF